MSATNNSVNANSTTPLPAIDGGTGVSNTGTWTNGGNVSFTGAHTFAGALTGDTSVTFPTSGTLATTTGAASPTQVQQGAFNVGLDSGIADAYIVTLSPAVAGSITDGMIVIFSPLHTSLTAAPTLQLNALAPVPMTLNTAALLPGDINQDIECVCIYDAAISAFCVLNPVVSHARTDLLQGGTYFSGVTSGTADAIVVTNSINHTIASLDIGAIVAFTATAPNATTTPTMDWNGTGALTIILPSGGALAAGDIVSGQASICICHGGDWILLNPGVSTGAGVTADQVQQNAFNIGTDSGTANNYVITLSPAPAAYTDGMIVGFTPAHSNNAGGCSVQIAGLASKSCYLPNYRTSNNYNPQNGDFRDDNIAYVIYSLASDAFFLLNPSASWVGGQGVQQGTYNYCADSGTADVYVGSYNQQPLLCGALFDGQIISLNVAHTNVTTSPTFQAPVGSALPIVNTSGPTQPGDLVAGRIAYFIYDSGGPQWILLNPAASAASYSLSTSWTPTFTFSTPGDLSVVYSVQTGTYATVGALVIASSNLAFTPTYTTSAGAAEFPSFPFSASSITATNFNGSVVGSGTSLIGAGLSLTAQIQNGTAIALILASGSAGGITALGPTNFISGQTYTIEMTITYSV